MAVILETQGLMKDFGGFVATNNVSLEPVSYTHLTLPTNA